MQGDGRSNKLFDRVPHCMYAIPAVSQIIFFLTKRTSVGLFCYIIFIVVILVPNSIINVLAYSTLLNMF